MLRRLGSIAVMLGLVWAVAVSPVAGQGSSGHRDPRLPSRIDLPDGFQPEGITSVGSRLFVGSLADGAIWKGSAVTGRGSILVPGIPGEVAVGLDHDGWRNRLWVAGGPTGEIRAYNARTGRLLQTYTFTAGFLNDLVVTPRAVYATDSLTQQLAVVPLGRWGRLPDPSKARVLPLTGDLVYTTGFNLNGIDAARGKLVVVQSNTGLAFRVNPRTGATSAIDTGGYSLTNGDGLEIRGGKLYVLRNRLNLVAVLRLNDRLSRARLIREITSSGFDVPTTATFALGKLWAVNARFGTTPTPTTDYWITRVPAR